MVDVESVRVIKPIRLISKSFWGCCEIKDVEAVFEDIGRQQPGQVWEYNLDIRGKLKSITVDAAKENKVFVRYEKEVYHSKNDFKNRLKEFGCGWVINEV